MADNLEIQDDKQEENSDKPDNAVNHDAYALAVADPLDEIRQILKSRHGSQKELAEKMPMSKSAMSALMTGKTKRVDVKTLDRMRLILGISDKTAEARAALARENAAKMLDTLGISGAAQIHEAMEAMLELSNVNAPDFRPEAGADALKRLAKVMSKFKA